VQSGSAGCADKSGSYAILPVKTATAAVKNLSCRVQSGFAGCLDNSGSYVVLWV
jgi:hypothetical protein